MWASYRSGCLVLLCGLQLLLPAGVAAAPFEWEALEPGEAGFAPMRLEAARADLAAHKTTGLLIVRHDRLVLEWYAAGTTADSKHYSASLAKAVVGGISLALAIDGGRIALDDPAAKFIPAWAADPKRNKITVRHLGSHTSGIEDAEQDDIPHEKLTGWKGDFWKRLPPPGDPFTISRDTAPVIFDPGSKFAYSNPGIALLGWCVTGALKDAPHDNLRDLLKARIFEPIGVPANQWSVGYGQTTTVDGLPLVASWGGGGFTARSLARVGRLMLRDGDWEGRRLISAKSVELTTADAGTPGPCGMAWWTNADGRIAGVPKDAYWAAGAGHQILLVVPSLQLIVVRNGADLDPKLKSEEALAKFLLQPVVGAVEGGLPQGADAPRSPVESLYPASPVIAGVRWAPVDSIVRKAKGGDNWPLTWGDDDALYTAYGDGRGFEPFVEKKLSLGFARVLGGPEDFRGENIRSASGEDVGDDVRGKKASGLVMVDGALLLWRRNAGNSELLVSHDHARTWEHSGCKFTTSFGCPTCLNFGRNYASARDEYLYVYSHDSDSAYTPADRMVLARVPKDKFAELAAYEFFERWKSDQPQWTRDIARRGAVFAQPGNCYRSGITYCAPLQRYLWCQILPGESPRFSGGFGIYDAPEPWGPWTTVYFTPQWDVGPGETSSLPTKWMSEDGRTLHLVFSGDDYFSVRRLELEVRP